MLPLLSRLNQPQNQAAFVMVNIMLGTSPLIAPEPFFRAGVFFSICWTIFVTLISIKTALYIGQTMIYTDQQQKGKHLQIQEEDVEQSLITDHPLQQTNSTKINALDHSQQFSILFGKKWASLPAISIIIYLTGVVISKCIITANVLAKLFSQVEVLNYYEFWLLFFFLFSAAFSFRSIQKTKLLQVVIISVRFIAIVMLIIGALILICQNGGIKDLALEGGNGIFNTQYFGDAFSNIIFISMIQHSVPDLAKQLTDFRQISQFLKRGFLIVGSTIITILVSACLAFGNDLVEGKDGTITSSHHLRYYNEDFKGRIDIVYYFVSFYVFLTASSFPVNIIIIRRNVLSLVRPTVDSDVVSKTTLLTSLLLLAFILLVSYFLRNDIQTALNFTGGILGSFIMFIMPCLGVYKARQMTRETKKLGIVTRWTPLLIIFFGVAAIIFSLYQTISNLIN